MTTAYTREQLFQAKAWKTVRRPGTAAEWITGAAFDLFTVNGVVMVSSFFGICTTLIAGAILPTLRMTTLVPVATVDLSVIAVGSFDTHVAGSVYGITGLVTDDLVVCTVIGAQDGAATQSWNGNFIVLTAGTVIMLNGVASTAGVIDWYITYLPMAPNVSIVAA